MPGVIERFPLLFAPQRWDWASVDGQFSTGSPPDELVTKVHVVGFDGDRIVLCRDARPVWFLPGGTREADEPLVDCAARELLEEAGAVLRGPLHVIGAHLCLSDLPQPYRPYHPHPRVAWLWCFADVSVEAAPLNPADGEQVVEVRAVEVAEARERLLSDGPWYPELVDLAVELRAAGTAPTV
ncbi:NUDIX domain-containing protein [Catellatospora sp. KI3]|uniref:NUDIX domain-containing protein n=1 Tax=Catellatospora sp. KI3 TaxID=3041620 RepID=UPI002482E7E2|nr:NUDIX domain-containing protein [Catellatospora sp. KI3]MDI1462410.1 NUDIX domain-containing protein [Catellatospora sp. KI3]